MFEFHIIQKHLASGNHWTLVSLKVTLEILSKINLTLSLMLILSLYLFIIMGEHDIYSLVSVCFFNVSSPYSTAQIEKLVKLQFKIHQYLSIVISTNLTSSVPANKTSQNQSWDTWWCVAINHDNIIYSIIILFVQKNFELYTQIYFLQLPGLIKISLLDTTMLQIPTSIKSMSSQFSNFLPWSLPVMNI